MYLYRSSVRVPQPLHTEFYIVSNSAANSSRPATYADSKCTCADSVSHVPPVQSLPEPMQLLPELDMFGPALESTDAFDQLGISFVIWTPRTPAASQWYPLF
ncbi:hypothetical protein TNCV_2773361 [Trichonephila clavipes]|nr:hypothetical protein TNCV_2773361 [Trichonephila clavipes]